MCVCLFSQHEAKMKSLTENLREIDTKKRTLEDEIDNLNEEIANLKTRGM